MASLLRLLCSSHLGLSGMIKVRIIRLVNPTNDIVKYRLNQCLDTNL